MYFINDEVNINEGCPLLPKLIPLESIDLFPTYSELAALNEQITKLTKGVNTQALRVEIEHTKREKLRIVLKPVKREMNPIDRHLLELRSNINILKEQLEAVRNMYESEIARIDLTTYRCFSRLHQIMLVIVARIPMLNTQIPLNYYTNFYVIFIKLGPHMTFRHPQRFNVLL